MVIVGAHYLPFSFLYGMRHFLPLGALMLAAGVLTALYLPDLTTMGALLTSLLLVAFAFIGRNLVSSREASPPRPAA